MEHTFDVCKTLGIQLVFNRIVSRYLRLAIDGT